MIYNKTLRYRYLNAMQSIYIWLHINDAKWFIKICDLIDEIHGDQRLYGIIEIYEKERRHLEIT